MDWQWAANLAIPAIGAFVLKAHGMIVALQDKVLVLENRTPTPNELQAQVRELNERCHRYELDRAAESSDIPQIKAQLLDHAAEIKAIGKSLHNINNALVRIEAMLESK